MIKLVDVKKTFGTPPTNVLKGISLDIKDGEFVALTGKSGSGKSTLLYIVSTLDNPSSGEVEISDEKVTQMSQKRLHEFRNEKMGFVFQFHYLLPELTALENVLMPARKTNKQIEKREHAEYLLKEFGLDKKHDRLPRQLSGGEQQRVAIARALIMQPQYLFADEPTGNLDSVNGEKVMNIFKTINQDMKTTVIMVTHDPDFAQLASRQIFLVDGLVSKGT
jgi:putative ABC transport system ATP-binding protein/lipoprotein-releasing system ATP-binding protein